MVHFNRNKVVKGGNKMTLKQIYSWLGIIVAVVVLGLFVATSWYTVDESEQAVLITFGEAEDGTLSLVYILNCLGQSRPLKLYQKKRLV